MNLAVDVSKVIFPFASDRDVAETVLVSVPPVNVTVCTEAAVPYFLLIVAMLDVNEIAGLTVKVTTVEVSR